MLQGARFVLAPWRKGKAWQKCYTRTLNWHAESPLCAEEKMKIRIAYQKRSQQFTTVVFKMAELQTNKQTKKT